MSDNLIVLLYLRDKLVPVQLPELLNCYTFNHRNLSVLYTAQRPGENYGD